MKPSNNRDRMVDCMEEFVKYTIVVRPHFDLFGDRFSERVEIEAARRKAQLAAAEASALIAANAALTLSSNGITVYSEKNGTNMDM